MSNRATSSTVLRLIGFISGSLELKVNQGDAPLGRPILSEYS